MLSFWLPWFILQFPTLPAHFSWLSGSSRVRQQLVSPILKYTAAFFDFWHGPSTCLNFSFFDFHSTISWNGKVHYTASSRFFFFFFLLIFSWSGLLAGIRWSFVSPNPKKFIPPIFSDGVCFVHLPSGSIVKFQFLNKIHSGSLLPPRRA